MKKILLLLLLLSVTVRAQNPTLVYGTNGVIVLPANQHTGKIFVGVDTTGAALNDVLTFDGSTWVPAAGGGGGGGTNGITALATTFPFITTSVVGTTGHINSNATKIAINTFTDNNGTALTNLNGSNISTGTIPTARLGADVVLTNGTQYITGTKFLTSYLTVGTNVNSLADLYVQSTDASRIGLILEQTTSPSADLVNFLDPTGSLLFRINSSGNITAIGGDANFNLTPTSLTLYSPGGTAIIQNGTGTDNSNIQIKTGSGAGNQIKFTSSGVDIGIWDTNLFQINSNESITGSLNGILPAQFITNVIAGTGISVSGAGTHSMTVNATGGGGGGDVFTASNNVLTAVNTFNGSLTASNFTAQGNATVNGSLSVTKSFITGVQVLTSPPSGTITNDWSLGNQIDITLTNNITIARPSNIVGHGYRAIYKFRQGPVGSRTVTFASPFQFSADSTMITNFVATTTSNKTDYVGVIVDINSSTTNLNIIAVQKGY